MTKLKPGKPTVRETATREACDPVIAELHSNHLVLRVKGRPVIRVEFDYLFLLRQGRKMARRA